MLNRAMLSKCLISAAIFALITVAANVSVSSARSLLHPVIKEDLPAGTVLPDSALILQENGIDDGTYMMMQHAYFEFRKPTSELVVKKLLDRDAMCPQDKMCCDGASICRLTLNFVNNQAIPVKRREVRIDVIDVNDHSPRFPQALRTITLVEDTPVGHSVRLQLAEDRDADENAVVLYTLTPETSEFGLKQDSGSRKVTKLFLELRSGLDRETKASHEFVLTAFDSGKRSGTMRIVINVTDSNDFHPYFPSSQVTARVPESQKVGSCIANLTARDDDEGINAKVVYDLDTQLLSQTELQIIQRHFTLQRSSGRICLRQQLDYEEKAEYELLITAKNVVPPTKTERPSTATVTVIVEDENDEIPVAKVHYLDGTQSIASVVENQRDGKAVALVTVTDRDKGANGKVSCELQRSEDKDHFHLYQSNGYSESQQNGKAEYYFATKDGVGLDREALIKDERVNPTLIDVQLTIPIVCRDGGRPIQTAQTSLSVRVLDLNDNSPALNVLTASGMKSQGNIVTIDENMPANSLVAKVEAFDPDYHENGTVFFSIDSSPQQTLDAFTISRDGRIITRRRLDREELNPPREVFQALVVAQDSGNPARSSTVSVEVHLRDLNDNPPQMEPHLNFKVLENNQPGFHVGQIEVSDPDRTGPLSVHIQSLRQQDRPPFQIRQEENRFYLVATERLDSEKVNEYQLVLVATDNARQGVGHSTTSTATVMVLDANDHAPQIVYPCNKPHRNHSVSWREGTGYTVVKVNAKDDDQDKATNGKFQFSLLSEGLFIIDHETGEVKVGSRMRFSDIGPKRLKVTVMDAGQPSSRSASCDFFIIVDNSEPYSLGNDRSAAAANSPAHGGGAGAGGGSGGSFRGGKFGDTGILVVIAVFVCLLLLVTLGLICYVRHWHQTLEFLPDLLEPCLGSSHRVVKHQPGIRTATGAPAGESLNLRMPTEAFIKSPGDRAEVHALMEHCKSTVYQTVPGTHDSALYNSGSEYYTCQVDPNHRRRFDLPVQRGFTEGSFRSLDPACRQQPYQTLMVYRPHRDPSMGCVDSSASYAHHQRFRSAADAAFMSGTLNAETSLRRSLHKSDSDLGPVASQFPRQRERLTHQKPSPDGDSTVQRYQASRSLRTLSSAGRPNPLRPYPSVQASYV